MDEQLRLGESDALVSLKRAWDKALKLLIPAINRPTFESFSATSRPISLDGDVATIGVPSELGKIFLEKSIDLVKTALESTLGREIRVVFVVTPQLQAKPKAKVEVQEKRAPVGTVSSISLPLNDKYVFQNFIVGPCNQMAHAAAAAVAEKPGKIYNPFFLYGGPGLGKTHLLQAVAHYVLENHPNQRIAYVSGEIFTTHFVTALREHRSEDFRRKYRSIDILIIDDLQFIAGKVQTKEEFFHTFNALYQMDKQIILCSDRSPRDLSPLEERLKSRFESGLVVDIMPPDLETRMAILQEKTASEKAKIPKAVLQRIAQMVPTNIRALEGALITLMAYTSLMKAPLTPQLAQEVLDRYLAEKKFTDLTPEMIQRAVARDFGIQDDDLRGAKRQKELVSARHIAMYLTRELTDYSLPAIGKAFGGRDHATVVHACRRIKDLLAEDDALKRRIENLSQGLKSGTI